MFAGEAAGSHFLSDRQIALRAEDQCVLQALNAPCAHSDCNNVAIIVSVVSAEWSYWSKSSKAGHKALTILLIFLLLVAMPTTVVMIEP